MSQFTSGKIECQAVRMIECAHLGSHQITEGHFHGNTVTLFRDRYGCDYRMRIARLGSGGVLRNSGRHRQAGQKKQNEWY